MLDSHWENLPERHFLATPYHEFAEVIGWDKAVELGFCVWEQRRSPSKMVGEDTRGVIYVPKRCLGTCFEWIKSIIGNDDAEKIVRSFGGEIFTFPSLVKASIKRRNAAIISQVSEGTRIAVVAALFGLTERRIRNILMQGHTNDGK